MAFNKGTQKMKYQVKQEKEKLLQIMADRDFGMIDLPEDAHNRVIEPPVNIEIPSDEQINNANETNLLEIREIIQMLQEKVKVEQQRIDKEKTRCQVEEETDLMQEEADLMQEEEPEVKTCNFSANARSFIPDTRNDFKAEVQNLCNLYLLEDESNTPDIVLIKLLRDTLDTFEEMIVEPNRTCEYDETNDPDEVSDLINRARSLLESKQFADDKELAEALQRFAIREMTMNDFKALVERKEVQVRN